MKKFNDMIDSIGFFLLFLGTSLRVAMFKRQKLLDTQRFLNDITPRSNDEIPVDSLNLQITGNFHRDFLILNLICDSVLLFFYFYFRHIRSLDSKYVQFFTVNKLPSRTLFDTQRTLIIHWFH